MERLDQGHLHPELQVLRLTCLSWESSLGIRGGRQAFAKSYTDSVLIATGTSTIEHLQLHMAPPCLCVT
jgi:hypothetical protein